MSLIKGALVQVTASALDIFPNVVAFQYNPASVSRTISPFGTEEGESKRGTIAPGTQPYEPKETIELTLELDGSDDLGLEDPLTIATGVAPRIAAIEKMLRPTKSLFVDIVESGLALGGKTLDTSALPERPTVPIVFFFWGPGRVLPVRITTYSIEEQSFHPTLFPLRATVTVTLDVLTPSAFACQRGLVVDIAKAVYKVHRLGEDGMALTQFAKNLSDGVRLINGVS